MMSLVIKVGNIKYQLLLHVTRLVLEGDRLPESDEGGVDRVDPAPLPRVPLLHNVDRLVRVRNVLVPRPLPFALERNFWINLIRDSEDILTIKHVISCIHLTSIPSPRRRTVAGPFGPRPFDFGLKGVVLRWLQRGDREWRRLLCRSRRANLA